MSRYPTPGRSITHVPDAVYCELDHSLYSTARSNCSPYRINPPFVIQFVDHHDQPSRFVNASGLIIGFWYLWIHLLPLWELGKILVQPFREYVQNVDVSVDHSRCVRSRFAVFCGDSYNLTSDTYVTTEAQYIKSGKWSP